MQRYRVIKRFAAIIGTSDPLEPHEVVYTQQHELEPIIIYSVQVFGNLRWHTVKDFTTIRAAAEFIHVLIEPRKNEI